MYSNILSISNFVYIASAFVLILSFIVGKKSLDVAGKSLFVLAFFVEFLYFTLRFIETYQKGYDYLPVTNAFESFVFFTLCLGFLQTLMIKKTSGFIVLFSSIVISTTLLALSIAGFSQHIEPLIPALKSNWLVAHVITSFLAYAAFAINFVASSFVLYSSQKRIDKIVGSIMFGGLLSLMFTAVIVSITHSSPLVVGSVFLVLISTMLFVLSFILKPYTSKEWIEKPLVFGFVLLTIGIITGSIWAKYAWGGYWSWDPKETWSFITWIIYLINLHFARKKKSARFLAYLGVIGFLSVLITYLGVNFVLPGLHSYGSN
ncbi:c-type cytochrome biogenesis protein CcsB [Desulfurella sp.]|uniref:c-type cytochrome biogenesis protein CcsB n=1 Tax=Desulfurella sp. TaxID=1962857 RepID=UPI0025B8B9F9|nr:c-type cytochrome biogenesis protein CcsB [Desulfurella sp.]